MEKYLWISRYGLLRAFFRGGILVEAQASSEDLSLRWAMCPAPTGLPPTD